LLFAQTSIRIVDFDVKPGAQEEVARLFADYHSAERKSCGAHLQRVHYLKGVTHRAVFTGDVANWGHNIEKTTSEWDAYIGKMRRLHNSASPSVVMTNLRWKSADREKNKVAKRWEMKIRDPEKFLKAYDTFIKSIDNVLENHITAVESIDLGGNGGTHTSWLSGNSLNDIILLEREIEKTKAFQTFIKERGEVELINSYLTTTIFTYN
ncbi:MAG: hypothetical protein QMA97_06145, partial [Glaciecola sp.]